MNCDFIDCAVTAAVKFAALTYYHYKNPDRRAIVSGNSICGATKVSLAGAGGTLSFPLGGAIVGNVISAGTGDAQFGHSTILSKVSVVGNRLSTVSGSNVYFTPALASVHSCSIAQNELSGGSAKVTLAGGSAFSICNSEVIGNKLSGAGDAAVCAILSLSASKDAASVLWSKIYGNDVSTGVYIQQLAKAGTAGYLNLNSSVFARDEGTLPFTPVAYADDAYADYFQIRFRESHLQNADAAAKYVDKSSTVGGVLQLLTDAPQVWPKTQTSADGFPYLRLASRSPYRKLAYRPFNVSSTGTQYVQVVFEETSGVWKYAYNLSKYTPTGSEVALGDLLGASRAEGDVRLGAIQEVQKLGLAVLVR